MLTKEIRQAIQYHRNKAEEIRRRMIAEPDLDKKYVMLFQSQREDETADRLAGTKPWSLR